MTTEFGYFPRLQLQFKFEPNDRYQLLYESQSGNDIWERNLSLGEWRKKSSDV